MFHFKEFFIFFSDDGERYDSEPDSSSFPPPQSIKRSVVTKEYKDTAETIDTPTVTDSRLSTPTRKPKTSTPSKKIDLGAAANYAKTQVCFTSKLRLFNL